MRTTALMTADELLALPTGLGRRYELVAGELHTMSPFGWRHGKVVSKLHAKLAAHVEKNDLGEMFGAETGFRLARDPDTVRAPDIAFIAKQDLPAEMPADGFWPGAPDLAVEVVSPGGRTREVDKKIAAWLAAGCSAVWIVDAKLRTVTLYNPLSNIQVKSAGEILTGDPVVRGFSCAVEELFR